MLIPMKEREMKEEWEVQRGAQEVRQGDLEGQEELVLKFQRQCK